MSIENAVVGVRDLRKAYGAFRAVDGVSFDIAHGETFALLGPNGAGKSTTIEILEGYRLRTSGEVSVLGEDPAAGRLEWKARLGIVLQSAGESGTATVREQLTQFARYYPDPRDVDELIAAVGLEQKAGTQIRRLSGGQQRRVDVALGIIGRPELLFLDEPTTGFDPEARRAFWQLIRDLQSEGTTILLTTHYLEEAATLADRVGVIAQGRMLDMGPVDDIGGADARIPIVRWRDSGGVHEARTAEPAIEVARLVERNGGTEPDGVEIVRPGLEEIYLDLVATARADAAREAEAGAHPPGDTTAPGGNRDTRDPRAAASAVPTPAASEEARR